MFGIKSRLHVQSHAQQLIRQIFRIDADGRGLGHMGGMDSPEPGSEAVLALLRNSPDVFLGDARITTNSGNSRRGCRQAQQTDHRRAFRRTRRQGVLGLRTAGIRVHATGRKPPGCMNPAARSATAGRSDSPTHPKPAPCRQAWSIRRRRVGLPAPACHWRSGALHHEPAFRRTRLQPLNPLRYVGILRLDGPVAVPWSPGPDVPAHQRRVARRNESFLHDASSTARSRPPDRIPALPRSRSS